MISTAGDGALSVADPSSSNTGQLVNGTFTLPSRCRPSASSWAAPAAAFAPVGGSANPTTLLTYSGPESNDAVTLNFRQVDRRTEALRTAPTARR